VPLHRRLFGHGRPTGACTERALLTRPTDHLEDNRSVEPIAGSDRVSEALSTRYLQREASMWILTADSGAQDPAIGATCRQALAQ
jgi:hypothetical protein